MGNSTLKYNRSIDGLRFVAIMGVLIQHFIPLSFTTIKQIPFGAGVHLFFVISGFLITRILLTYRDKTTDSQGKKSILKAFFFKRILRIFPIYYLLLGFLLIIGFQNVYDIWGWIASYTSNIYQALNMPYMGSFSHMWSLAVEEQFYLFWPFLILFIPRKHTFKVIVSMIVIAVLFKVCYWIVYGPGPAITTLVISCGDSLGLGALAAYLQLYRPNVLQEICKIPFVILLSIIPFVLLVILRLGSDFFPETLGNFLFSIFSFILICKAATQSFSKPLQAILESSFSVYIGKISYGIYLFHLFMPDLFNYMNTWLPRFFYAESRYRIVFLFVSSVVFAMLSWHLIEKPILRKKNAISYLNK